MGGYIGDKKINKAYIADKEVKAMYLGNTKIFESGGTIDPVLENNDWATINAVFKAGNAAKYWKVGDTKSITSKSGKTYTTRIADMQSGRYDYADGSGSSKGVLEFVELYNLNGTTSWRMNTSDTNTGGWANSYLRNTTLPTLLADLPDDMVGAISEVSVLSGTGGDTSSGTSSSTNKIFIPAEIEIFDAKHYSIGIAESPLGQFDYYKAHNTDADRIKRFVGTTNADYYWLRSPQSGSSEHFCIVTNSGHINSYYASNVCGVGLCFAI